MRNTILKEMWQQVSAKFRNVTKNKHNKLYVCIKNLKGMWLQVSAKFRSVTKNGTELQGAHSERERN